MRPALLALALVAALPVHAAGTSVLHCEKLFDSRAGKMLGPHLVTRATGDWLDVVAYGLGAGLAAWWWRPRAQPSPSPSSHEL